MDSTQLSALRSKIADSFLRSFYPIDHRNLKNQERSISRVALENVHGKLKTTSSLTAKIAARIGKVMSMVSEDVDDMITSTDRLQATVEQGDQLAGTNSEKLSSTLGWLGDLILGGYLAKKMFGRGKKVNVQEPDVNVKVDKDGKPIKEGEKQKFKAEPETKPKLKLEPEVKAPEIKPVKPKLGGKWGAVLGIGAAVGGSYLLSKGVEGAMAQGQSAPPPEAPPATPQPLAPAVPGPPAVPPPPSYALPPPTGDVSPLPPPPETPWQPPDTTGNTSEQALRTAQQKAEQDAKTLEQFESGAGGTGEKSDTTATFNTKPDTLDTGAGFEQPDMATIRTSTGRSTQVNAYLAPNFQGFINALEATGYKISSLGGYVNRNIAGSSTKSWHAWGAAIDINPGGNPHLKDGTMQTDMPPDVGSIAAQFGLGWGGNWQSSKDTMHFSAARNEGGSFNIDRTTGQIQPMAEGGIVKKPTLALIGEAGEPEYVVPQSKVHDFAHEMMAQKTRTIKKKKTHYVFVPVIT